MVRYDFENKGVVQREDVRLILSYVPFRYEEDFGATQSVLSMQTTNSQREGLYDSTKVNFQQRKHD